MPGEMEDFRREVIPLLETFRSIDLRVVADRLPDKRWRVLRLRALMSPDGEVREVPNLPDLPNLLAMQRKLPATALETILAELDRGQMDIDGTTVHVEQDVGNNTWRPLNWHTRSYERSAALGEFRIDWHAAALIGYGSITNTGQWYRDRDRMSAALRHGDPPWDGLSELYRGFIGDAAATGDLRDTSAWVLAPTPLRISAVGLGPELSVEVECADTIDPSQAMVAAIFSMGGATASRRRASLKDSEHTGDVYRLLIPVPPEFSGVVCALTYGGLDADRREIFRPGAGGPPRSWSVLSRTIGNPETFHDRVDRLDGGDPLEHWVAVLFTLLGFSVVHFGKQTFKTDTADILAFSTVENFICVVEVTAGGSAREPDLTATIEKLAARAKEVVRDAPGDRVIPVLVTPRDPDLITEGARSRAASERVALVTSDTLQQLVMLSTANPPPSLVADFLSRTIPSGYGL